MLWDRRTDTFELGQWLGATIYGHRSDISPDGGHIIYFASNGNRFDATKGSWTAVSRTPYLKALALFGKGDLYEGGGLFTSNTRYWLNEGRGTQLPGARYWEEGGDRHFRMIDSAEVERDFEFEPPTDGSGAQRVYFSRLQRDGWQKRESPDRSVYSEKQLRNGWILRKRVGVGHQNEDTHELIQCSLTGGTLQTAWDWADLDNETIVFAEGGVLYRCLVGVESLGTPVPLIDLTDWTFQTRPAPY